MNIKEFEKLLQKFYSLLLQEKNCLVKTQPDQLLKIVDEKQAYLQPFQAFTGELTPAAKNLIKKIQQQQQENLLLTKQSLGFAEMLLRSIRDNLKGSKTTYSKDSSRKTRVQEQVSLIDRKA
jgi:hypothetical protein